MAPGAAHDSRHPCTTSCDSSYGNAFLSDRSISLSRTNSTLQFCNCVEFLVTQRRWFSTREQVIADAPDAWFGYLRGRGCTGLRLVYFPSSVASFPGHMLAGFVGGGGRWLIADETKDRTGSWEAAWQVTAKDAPDRRIWSVSYRRVTAPRHSGSPNPDLATIREELGTNLIEIRDFAQSHKLDGFAKCFQSALDCLDAEKPLTKIYHTDLVPSDWYSLTAEQTLATCSEAWVFGGMGSWNDLGFEGDANKTYERLSKGLYAAIIHGIVSAVNSKTR